MTRCYDHDGEVRNAQDAVMCVRLYRQTCSLLRCQRLFAAAAERHGHPKEAADVFKAAHDEVTATIARNTERHDAVQALVDAGALREKKEDRSGDTKSGWWMDDVYLATADDPVLALQVLNGN